MIKYEKNEIGFSMPIDKLLNEKINNLYKKVFPAGSKMKSKFKQAIIRFGVESLIEKLEINKISFEDIRTLLKL